MMGVTEGQWQRSAGPAGSQQAPILASLATHLRTGTGPMRLLARIVPTILATSGLLRPTTAALPAPARPAHSEIVIVQTVPDEATIQAIVEKVLRDDELNARRGQAEEDDRALSADGQHRHTRSPRQRCDGTVVLGRPEPRRRVITMWSTPGVASAGAAWPRPGRCR